MLKVLILYSEKLNKAGVAAQVREKIEASFYF